jgi:hypothetical protein
MRAPGHNSILIGVENECNNKLVLLSTTTLQLVSCLYNGSTRLMKVSDPRIIKLRMWKVVDEVETLVTKNSSSKPAFAAISCSLVIELFKRSVCNRCKVQRVVEL